MNASVEQLLRAADPASAVAPTPKHVQDERITEILTRDPSVPVTRPPRNWRRRRLLLVLVWLTVLAIAAGSAVSQRNQLVFLAGDRAAWADKILARAVETASDPAIESGQYLRVQTDSVWQWWWPIRQAETEPPTSGLMIENTIVEYVAPDGSQPRCTVNDGPQQVGTFGPGPFPEALQVGTSAYCVPPRLSWYGQEQIGRMPTDAEGVAEFIFWHHEASQGDSTEEQRFEYAVRILTAPETPVEQRVAVLGYLIELDGVEVVDPDVRLLGRQGVAIGFAGATPVYPDQFPITLLVDADSAEIFGTGLVSVAESADFGSVFTRTVVDDLPEEVIDMACQTHREAPDYANPFVCPET